MKSFKANKVPTRTLGGNYIAPFYGESFNLGEMAFDPDCGITVLSWKRLWDLGRLTVDNETSSVKVEIDINESVITLEFNWVEDILAGDISEYINAIDNHRAYAVLRKQWTSSSDEPSELLEKFKIVKDMSTQEIEGLDMVHRALKATWSSSEQDLISRVQRGELVGTKFDVADIRRYFKVFDKDLQALKGRAEDENPGVDAPITGKIEGVILHCDLMFVCGIPFLVSIDSKHKFVCCAALRNLEAIHIVSELEETRKFYELNHEKAGGVKFDRQTGVSANLVLDITGLTLMSKSTNVFPAESVIKLIKQRIRSKVSEIPAMLPKTVVINVVMGAVSIVNTISRSGNENRISARKSLQGATQEYESIFALSPSDYCEVQYLSDNDVMHDRTVPALALRVDPSNSNDWFFYNLVSGKVFTRHYSCANVMPWSSKVSERISYLATLDPIKGDSELGIKETEQIDPEYFSHQTAPNRPGRKRKADQIGIMGLTKAAAESKAAVEPPPSQDYVSPKIFEPSTLLGLREFKSMSEEGKQSYEESNYADWQCDGTLCYDVSTAVMVQYRDIKEGYNYSIQVSPKQSIELFGDELTRQALVEEIEGLLSRKAFSAVLKSSLSNTQKKRIIRMSTFLKQKFDSTGKLLKLKARLVAGGNLQDRSLYTSEEMSSPTVATQNVFSIISIALSEGRKLMTFDVNMAYLEADMKDEVYMTLDPLSTQMLIDIDPSYAHTLDGKTVTVKLEKALYGCVQSGKLWYDRLKNFLLSIVFTTNAMDPCVFNRMSPSGKQLTIAMHVDDGLVTCEDEQELDRFEKQLKDEFKISCSRGPVVEYLGMKIDTTHKDGAEITMARYISEVVSESGVTKKSRTPAQDNLFKIDVESKILDASNRQRLHRLVAQLLYLATRVRPDIMLPVLFLCSRVNIATVQDQKKLDRIMEYLCNTGDLGIVIGERGKNIELNVFADASFAVHGDMKSHSGIWMSHGRGPILCKCGKQKLVSRSSTEAELITLSDSVSLAAGHVQFLQAQGIKVVANIQQDNMSTIALAEKGRSTSDRTRHVNIRYFFVKQYLDEGTMKISYCPTKSMIADILTKPLQGEHFESLRSLLLGYTVQ